MFPYELYTRPTRIPVQIDLPLLLSKKKYRPKLNVTYRTARYQGITRTFTGSDSRGPYVPCRRFNVAGLNPFDRFFIGKRLSRLTVYHISNLTKIDKGVPLLFIGPLAVRGRDGTARGGGARPGRDWESALAARGRAC